VHITATCPRRFRLRHAAGPALRPYTSRSGRASLQWNLTLGINLLTWRLNLLRAASLHLNVFYAQARFRTAGSRFPEPRQPLPATAGCMWPIPYALRMYNRMNIKSVGYFLAVCEERNFGKAAQRSGVSQPTVSLGIQRLERELGGRLLHRSRGKVMGLTRLGRQLHPIFKDLDRSADKVKRVVKQHYSRERLRPPKFTVVTQNLNVG
jgi:hypothetical protein